MNASIADFRTRAKDIMEAIDRNETVHVFYRGKEKAVMVPVDSQEKHDDIRKAPAFGMWADREDMEDVHAWLKTQRRRRRHGL